MPKSNMHRLTYHYTTPNHEKMEITWLIAGSLGDPFWKVEDQIFEAQTKIQQLVDTMWGEYIPITFISCRPVKPGLDSFKSIPLDKSNFINGVPIG